MRVCGRGGSSAAAGLSSAASRSRGPDRGTRCADGRTEGRAGMRRQSWAHRRRRDGSHVPRRRRTGGGRYLGDGGGARRLRQSIQMACKRARRALQAGEREPTFCLGWRPESSSSPPGGSDPPPPATPSDVMIPMEGQTPLAGPAQPAAGPHPLRRSVGLHERAKALSMQGEIDLGCA